MYINWETIITVGKVIGALGVIISSVVALYKTVESIKQNERQWRAIRQSREEQTLICYGVRACLQGLIEQGCDGPCKDALDKLENHLNKEAHDQH